MNDLERLLRDHLSDWRSGWSMGSFGAIAEFHQDEGEPAVINEPHRLTRATRRGAIRIDHRLLQDISPVAYETLSPKRHRWSHAVALCLPRTRAEMPRRTVLTELGPDDGAIRGIDRTGIVFDMGLSLPQCDFCIRTSDPKVLSVLRANLGRSLFEPGNSAMQAILMVHPHRIALTALGRVEVYQKIGGPDTGGVSPAGPHTHVLPKLLRSGRTHSANTPIPDGLTPVASLHPGNPVISAMGEDRPFDAHLHAAFQSLLGRYGAPDAVAVKQEVGRALAAGRSPDTVVAPDSRTGRSALRIAIRQLGHDARVRADVEMLERLEDWFATHEGHDDMADDDAPGH